MAHLVALVALVALVSYALVALVSLAACVPYVALLVVGGGWVGLFFSLGRGGVEGGEW